MTCPKAFAGVTLVESLIVLSLSTSLLLLTVSQVTSWRRQVAYDYFVAEFERSLVYTQQAAILSQRGSRVLRLKVTSLSSVTMIINKNNSAKHWNYRLTYKLSERLS
ncbi:hypothetical protein [Vagococcus salmoninarum]|uniref:hypothetical protein n=1 Tax=Vagococcus salmoninarum TaxID=2739 RepID=UPI00398A630C